MKVLIVDDDAALGSFLQKGLIVEGHETDWVGDGEAALSLVAEREYDLVVLDLGLPRKDGTEVLVELRARSQQTAVLVLTGRSDLNEKVRCFNLGADDCLLKPFSFHELRARCKALLRRREQYADPILRHGPIELNRMTHKVTRDGHVVDLTGKEFSLLEFLLARQGQCCSRTELLREVWQMVPDAGTNVVDVYVNYLRKKLAPAGQTGAGGVGVIETIRGSGYVIGGSGAKKPVRSEGVFGAMPLRIADAR